ncbi:tyrosine-type recombinase/integrase [Acuticoccus yangtzensis]|uniref:tyrosine-type recombinase/integrase n=1 Tax=Acuticoccus yangtzensis TaxID=1443441 RepID=UPI00094969F0|nr:integrase arm-type DNA-binding domain-containing protein [Acuticoccus yangtzensis]
MPVSADVRTDTTGKPKGPHPQRRLTAAHVRRAGPGRHSDGNGLYLEVDPSGARRWTLRTVVHGRRRDIGLGSASIVSLADARTAAQHLRAVARSGGNPITERDKGRAPAVTFADAACSVHAEHIVPNSRNGKHVQQWLATLERYAFPTIGDLPVASVEQADVLRVLAPIWTECPETARRVRQRLRTVLDWARTAGYREGVNPVEGVEKGLAKQRDKTEHHAALPYNSLPDFWTKLGAVNGMGALALSFTILTAARSGEVRGAGWDEIDLDARVWTVPADRMKARTEHRVPLSEAAVAVLEIVRPLAGNGGLVFPSRVPGRALSDATLAAVMKRLGVAVTVHGFRSTFRDWAEEVTDYPHEVKEAALAHTVASKTERAYRRTDLFEPRREMMGAWAKFALSGRDASGSAHL